MELKVKRNSAACMAKVTEPYHMHIVFTGHIDSVEEYTLTWGHNTLYDHQDY